MNEGLGELRVSKTLFLYAELAQWYSTGLLNRHSERVLGSSGACLAPTEAERRNQSSNLWLCVSRNSLRKERENG